MVFRESLFTPTEWRVLVCLRLNVGHVVSHRDLIAAMRGFGRPPIFPTNRQMRELRQTISRLRQKIEKDPAPPDILLTHRGEGYSFQREGREWR